MMNLKITSMRLSSVVLVIIVSPGSFSMAQDQQPQRKNSTSDDGESVDVRYAQAHLELAELDLRQALKRRKQMPRVFSKTALEKLRRHVEIDREQLNQLRRGGEPDVHEIFLRSAESAARNAEEEAKRQRQVYQKAPTDSNSMDLDRAVAVAKLAHLHLERTRARKVSESDVYLLRWQIEELQTQVLELQHQMLDFQREEKR